MSTDLVTIGSDATLAQATKLMTERRSSDCPSWTTRVGWIGIVSRVHLIKVFLRSNEEILREVFTRVR